MLGLKKDTQAAIRKKLKGLGLLEEKLRGIPARLHYRVDSTAYLSFLAEENRQLAKYRQQDGVKPISKKAVNRQQDGGEPKSKEAENRQQDGGESVRASARRLIETVLGEYRIKHQADPVELFIHAKASFSDEEWDGFMEAATGRATNVVGVQISDAWDRLKLFRPGAYPVVRGTALITSPRSGFLWTSGYVPRLDTYMGPETPNPLQVSVRRGDADIEAVMSDVLSLSKINFNTCLFNDREPVTIKFADAIGDILTAAPVHSEPKLPFKFYI